MIPAKGTTLARLKDQTDASIGYWEKKSKRLSPTGLGQISTRLDSKMPMYGIASLEQRMSDAADMGGMQQKTVVRLGKLVLHERDERRARRTTAKSGRGRPRSSIASPTSTATGISGSPPPTGATPRRLLKGDFTLPAWSDDGKAIAVAEKKDGGRRWDISVVPAAGDLAVAEMIGRTHV